LKREEKKEQKRLRPRNPRAEEAECGGDERKSRGSGRQSRVPCTEGYGILGVWRVRSNAKRNINEMTVMTITRIKYKQKHKRTAAKREQIREKCGGRIVP